MNGNGICYYYNGDKYIGQFANDKLQGKGVYYYSNGDRYECEWNNYKLVGEVMFYRTVISMKFKMHGNGVCGTLLGIHTKVNDVKVSFVGKECIIIQVVVNIKDSLWMG
jgi:hypothetical protein